MTEPESEGPQRPRVVVWSLAIAETIVWACMFYMFPALLQEWEQGLGWSKTELSGAFTLSIAISAIVAPWMGRQIDTGKGHLVLAGSALGGGILLIALSQVQEVWQFYVIWAGLGIAMGGALYEPCFAFITWMFGGNAKRAITTITLVAGLAGTVSFPSASVLSDFFGWRVALLIFAGAVILIAVPLMWNTGRLTGQLRLAKAERQKEAGHSSIAAVLKSPVFWLLAFGFSAISLQHGMLITHFLPMMNDRGLSPDATVLAASMIGPMQVAGRLAMMGAERHVSMRVIGAGSYCFIAVACIALYGAKVIPLLVVAYVFLQGSGYGVTSIVRPVITADYLGRTNFGAISGAIAIPFVGGTAAAATVSALIWEQGGYDAVILVSGALAVLGLAAFLLASKIAGTAPHATNYD